MDEDDVDLVTATTFLRSLLPQPVVPFEVRSSSQYPPHDQVNTVNYPPAPSVEVSDSNIHHQTCTLLTRLPPELLTQIFTHCLLAESDISQPYIVYTSQFSERGIRSFPRVSLPYLLRIHTALLLSCKQIYFAARTLPLSLNSHAFWPFEEKYLHIVPKPGKTWPRTGREFGTLQEWQRDAVRSVKFILPERLPALPRSVGQMAPPLIHQRMGRSAVRAGIVALTERRMGFRMRGLRRLIFDLHQPILWARGGWKYEIGRSVAREGNIDGVWEGVNWLLEAMRRENGANVSGLREVIIVVDWWKGTHQGLRSGIWETIRTWEWKGMRLQDDGSGNRERTEADRENKYELRVLKWIACDEVPS